jgi:Na+/H+ antiporter NhaD/arsenite permease-like protein
VGHEYLSFIVLIAALFVVAGGIHITVRGEATPGRNVTFLFIGALLANVIGTTGASMLFIRPWIRMNKYRITAFHIVFFIFIVSNCGGCLTAIGDPPLFLGYLKGVPFSWVPLHCWPAWLVTNGLLLALFYVLDDRNFMRAPAPVRMRETAHEIFRLQGGANFAWLAVVLVAVFINEPVGLRELLMLVAASCSYRTTPQTIHAANHFSFAPVKEVAWLFLGIFVTMVPALDYLQLHATQLGLRTPLQFYWLSGLLSTVLDNAPTYLAFLAAAFGIKGMLLDRSVDVARFVSEHGDYLLAISLGSVFFGAITYIGNAPNFMVKAIAERDDVAVPSFIGYVVKFAAPILLPILALVGWLFLGS